SGSTRFANGSCIVFHVAAIKPQLKQQLKNEEEEVGGTARLRCEISISKAEVEWRKDGVVLHSSSKYEMWQDGTLRELRVHRLEPSDAGEYSCKAGDETSSAKLTVKGKTCLLGSRLVLYCVQCPVTLGECRMLSTPGNPSLSVIPCLGFKVTLKLSLKQIWNGTTVSLNTRLSVAVSNETYFFSSDLSWFSFASNLHKTTPEPAS
uniref:Ig-like domain-containing protein n=1 Tax=Strix occidentalis caurina TaxID=311401 RepID=A0A8D0KTQ8_STROC